MTIVEPRSVEDGSRARRWVVLLVVVGVLVVAATVLVGYRLATGPRTTDTRIDRVVLVDDSTLSIEFAGGSCDDGYDVAVDQSAQAVTVTVRTTVSSGSCDDMGYLRTHEVVLDAPLGDRPVIDGTRDYVPRMTSPDGEIIREHTRRDEPLGTLLVPATDG